MGYLIGIAVWMLIGNIWVDLLNNVAKQFDGEDVDVVNRVVSSFTWPYSIYMFMKELERGYENKNRGDIPAMNESMNQMIDSIDNYVAKKLDSDLETYLSVIDYKCTDEEVHDIITSVMSSKSKKNKEYIRVKKLYESKISNK